ncbi:MAG: fructose-6-phosphate aldolase [Clostridia bacterium]|nr:fructose-6-phosphate aldolase [Clostridia bacterium]
MDFLFDTADIRLIERYQDMFNYTGVTTNPALIRKAGIRDDTFARLREIRSLIGFERSFHLQVVSHDADEMVREAFFMQEKVDDKIYIKIPVTPDGLKAIKVLTANGVRITATAIITQMQAILAQSMGADYIAIYYDQMCDNGINGEETIRLLSDERARKPNQKQSSILAANIKNMAQLRACFSAGADAITLNPELLEESIRNPQISKAVRFFDDAWEELHGKTHLCELNE